MTFAAHGWSAESDGFGLRGSLRCQPKARRNLRTHTSVLRQQQPAGNNKRTATARDQVDSTMPRAMRAHIGCIPAFRIAIAASDEVSIFKNSRPTAASFAAECKPPDQIV